MINCENEEDKLSIYNEDTVYSYDPCTNTQILNTTFEMRGIVNNYSNPINSTLAKLYEALLIRIYRNISIKTLEDIKKESIKDIDIAYSGYFNDLMRREELNKSIDGEVLLDRISRMLDNIVNKSSDNVVIYADLSKITSINIDLLADLASDMAQVEKQFLYDDLEYVDRKDKLDKLICDYADKISEYLSTNNIDATNYPYMDVVNYFKCVY